MSFRGRGTGEQLASHLPAAYELFESCSTAAYEPHKSCSPNSSRATAKQLQSPPPRTDSRAQARVAPKQLWSATEHSQTAREAGRQTGSRQEGRRKAGRQAGRQAASPPFLPFLSSLSSLPLLRVETGRVPAAYNYS